MRNPLICTQNKKGTSLSEQCTRCHHLGYQNRKQPDQEKWCVFEFLELKYSLRGVEWVHGLFLFPLVLGKM